MFPARALHLFGFAFLCALAAGCGEEPEQQQQEPAPMVADVPQTKEEAAAYEQSGKGDLPFDLCEKHGWYEDDTCDWFCADHDPVCHAEPLGPEPAGEALSFPVVLMHGFNAGRQGAWSFHRVEDALIKDGHTVFSAEVPAFESTEVRAASLATQIEALLERTGAARVHIIAHSMGGVDSRHLISGLGFGDRVATLTTISSPHHGTAVADVALRLVPGITDKLVNALATVWSKRFNEIEQDANVRAALSSLSTPGMELFNAENPDDARVFYQSWAGVSSVLGIDNRKDAGACEQKMLWHEGQSDVMNAQLVPMAAMIAPGLTLRPNDGMASVESAKWGVFQGCIPADHFDQVGQPLRERADKHTGFDHVRFYRNLAYGLRAHEG